MKKINEKIKRLYHSDKQAATD